MSRRYLFVMDPIERVDPRGDTTFDFLVETQRRGIDNRVCSIHDLWTIGGEGFARVQSVKVQRPSDEDPSHFSLGAHERMSFSEFDVIWMRKDPPVDDDFLAATMLLDRHDPDKTLVLNTPSSLRVANEKLWALHAPELYPRTIVTARRDVLVEELQAMGRGVVKPLFGAGGSGVMAFNADDKNARAAIDLLTAEGQRPALLQEYLPGVRNGDKRVILLGGEPIGSVVRVPQEDDHRANMHVGGTVRKGDIDDDDRRIAARLKPELLRLGLHFAGIDVIGGKLTEVNVTSPTGVQEIDLLDQRTGSARMSAQVMDYVDGLLERRGA
jgi:glutathione synthase